MKTLQPNDLESLTRIGSGQFGKVLIFDQSLALKVLFYEIGGEEHGELDKIFSVEHPNIVKCLRSVKIGQHSYGIIMELCDGNLEQYLKDQNNYITVQNVLEIMIQVGEGLEHLHENNIIHRDLNTKNILYKYKKSSPDKLEFKIGDFGLCKSDYNLYTLAMSGLGTPEYIAPEIFNRSIQRKEGEGQHYVTRNNAKVDIYSYGKIAMKVLSKVTDINTEAFGRCKVLFEKCCEVDPSRRPSLSKVLKELKGLQEAVEEKNPVSFLIEKKQEKKRESSSSNYIEFSHKKRISVNI